VLVFGEHGVLDDADPDGWAVFLAGRLEFAEVGAVLENLQGGLTPGPRD